jgi:hypothetical protein
MFRVVARTFFAVAGMFAVSRWREQRWAREGHGATYFARPALRQ